MELDAIARKLPALKPGTYSADVVYFPDQVSRLGESYTSRAVPFIVGQ